MDALDVMKVCLRRWYVMIPLVLMAIGAGVGLAQQQKPTYTAFGSFALVYTHGDAVKPNQVDPRSENPLAGGNAVLLGEALTADYMSTTKQGDVSVSGTSGTAPGDADTGTAYSVSLPPGSQSYFVQSWGPDPAALREVVDSVIESAPATARQIQDRAGAPELSQYTTFTTSPTQVGKLPGSSKVKLIGALGAVGVLAGAAMSIIADRILGRRRRLQDDRGLSSGGEPEGTDGTSDKAVQTARRTRRRSRHREEMVAEPPSVPDPSGSAAPTRDRAPIS